MSEDPLSTGMRILPFGSDGDEGGSVHEGEELVTDELRTPITPGVIEESEEHCQENILREHDRSVREVCDEAQQYIDEQEFAERRGNAFLQELAREWSAQDSLVSPILFRETEFFIAYTAEGYRKLADDIGLNDREVKALRYAHHRYAQTRGLQEWASEVCVFCVREDKSSRLRDLIDSIDDDVAGFYETEIDEFSRGVSVDR